MSSTGNRDLTGEVTDDFYCAPGVRMDSLRLFFERNSFTPIGAHTPQRAEYELSDLAHVIIEVRDPLQGPPAWYHQKQGSDIFTRTYMCLDAEKLIRNMIKVRLARDRIL